MNHLIPSELRTNVVVASFASALLESHYADSPEYSDMLLSLLRQGAESGDVASQSKLGAMYARAAMASNRITTRRCAGYGAPRAGVTPRPSTTWA